MFIILKNTIYVLSIFLALGSFARADTAQDWVRHAYDQIKQQEASKLTATALSYEQTLSVGFSVTDEGQLVQINVRARRASAAAVKMAREIFGAVKLPPPPSSLKTRRFDVPIRIAKTAPAKNMQESDGRAQMRGRSSQ